MDLESDMKRAGEQLSGKPANVGKPWTEEEIKKLLAGVSKGCSMNTLAINHQRTVGGITGRLREMAADYYCNNEMSIEKIQKFTGLSKEDIAESISRRTWKEEQAKNRPTKAPKARQPSEPNDLKEVLEILKDIQTTLKDFVKGNYVKVKRSQ